ncbi:hypothetical protein SH449x_004919 [Pirellulaceae bacterium SH449]
MKIFPSVLILLFVYCQSSTLNAQDVQTKSLEARVLELEQRVKALEVLVNKLTSQQSTVNSDNPVGVLPSSVLEQLGPNFEKLTLSMKDDEIFETLGLIEYRTHLESQSNVTLDGAGGNWRNYIIDERGYRLSFRDFFGSVRCMVKLPGENQWRSKETAAAPIRPSNRDLNPDR